MAAGFTLTPLKLIQTTGAHTAVTSVMNVHTANCGSGSNYLIRRATEDVA